MIQGANTSYELAEKADGTAYSGVAAVHAFVKKIERPNRIDEALHLFKKHLPYHEFQRQPGKRDNGKKIATCFFPESPEQRVNRRSHHWLRNDIVYPPAWLRSDFT